MENKGERLDVWNFCHRDSESLNRVPPTLIVYSIKQMNPVYPYLILIKALSTQMKPINVLT